jgi:hypothetical protein
MVDLTLPLLLTPIEMARRHHRLSNEGSGSILDRRSAPLPAKWLIFTPALTLELWRDSNEIFGMPKGGLDTPCSLVFALVLRVLETALFCSLRALLYR